ncbi:hypothetical protein MTR_0147s0020 [Medicago truncatula]|uniref:Uncharacterized protein n=1 Tax=Medicago truncatula TaxID=3880 RepID=A0A072TH74_MEDTR|nr:hypothetical protein MTR_0147s0020 [Medicago truncatula]
MNKGAHVLAQKMKELDMMDSGDLEHVLDIEEALHYYSRLKSPVYLDIVNRFFIDINSDFTLPQPSVSDEGFLPLIKLFTREYNRMCPPGVAYFIKRRKNYLYEHNSCLHAYACSGRLSVPPKYLSKPNWELPRVPYPYEADELRLSV